MTHSMSTEPALQAVRSVPGGSVNATVRCRGSPKVTHFGYRGSLFPGNPIYSFCIFLLLAFRPGAGLAVAQTQAMVDLTGKNVLVIHPGEANVPIFLKTDKGLSTTLESGGISDLNQFFESLNLRLNPGLEYRKALVEKLRLQYSHRKVGVIITMYPEALEFVLRDCGDIFPGVPIMALYLQKSLALSDANRTIVEHTAALDITGTLEIALSLVPGVKRVYVVSGVHEVDRQIEEQARRDLKKWKTRLQFQFLSHMPFEDMLATVSNVPPDSILLLLVLVQDVKGARYTTPTVAQRLSQVSAAPIFGIVDSGLGYGIVGGSLLYPERIGSKAGELALDFLRGILPPRDASKILNVPPVPMFDWRQIERWNLSEGALHKGSVVIDREFTLWDFKYYIIGVLVFSLAETFLIIFLVVQRRRKKLAEESLRKAEEKYRNIFEGAVEGIFESSPQGRPLTANPALARILGYGSADEFVSLVQDSANQVFADPDKRAEFTGLLEKQDFVLGFEAEFLRRDGTKIWGSINSRRVCGPDGKTLFYSGFLEDITERKRVEEALRESEKEARRIAREALAMAEIGRIITSTLTIEKVYKPFAAEVKKIVPFDRVVINMIDSEKGTVQNVYMAGGQIPDREGRRSTISKARGTPRCFERNRPFFSRRKISRVMKTVFPCFYRLFKPDFDPS
jgi:PAS domain S-box-containing protein